MRPSVSLASSHPPSIFPSVFDKDREEAARVAVPGCGDAVDSDSGNQAELEHILNIYITKLQSRVARIPWRASKHQLFAKIIDLLPCWTTKWRDRR